MVTEVEPKESKRQAWMIVGALIVFFLFCAAVPIVPVTYTDMEYRTVPVRYRIVDSKVEGHGILNWMALVTVVVENIDAEGGTFTVEFTAKEMPSASVSHYIWPGEEVKFSHDFDIAFSTDWYERYDFRFTVKPPTKTVTDYVTKQKPVTILQYLTGSY